MEMGGRGEEGRDPVLATPLPPRGIFTPLLSVLIVTNQKNTIIQYSLSSQEEGKDNKFIQVDGSYTKVGY